MTTPVAEKITVDFVWKGPNRLNGGVAGGGKDIKVVDLRFKDAKSEISVHLSEDIKVGEVKDDILFTVRKYSAGTERSLPDGRVVRDLLSETTPSALLLSLDQIRNLKLEAGLFERQTGEKRSRDAFETDQTTSRDVFRSNQEVKLEMPVELEMGQTYSIEMTSSKELALSARLVKVAPKSEELVAILGDFLLPIIGKKLAEFGERIQKLPDRLAIGLDLRIPTAQDVGIVTIQREVGNINPEVLKTLLAKIRASKTVSTEKTSEEQSKLQLSVYQACLRAIGEEGFLRIMRANAESFIAVTSRPPAVEVLINQIAEEFKRFCKAFYE